MKSLKRTNKNQESSLKELALESGLLDFWFYDNQDTLTEEQKELILNPSVKVKETTSFQKSLLSQLFAGLLEDEVIVKEDNNEVTLDNWSDYIATQLTVKGGKVLVNYPTNEDERYHDTLQVYKCSCGATLVDLDDTSGDYLGGCNSCGYSFYLWGCGYANIKEVNQAIEEGDTSLEDYIYAY